MIFIKINYKLKEALSIYLTDLSRLNSAFALSQVVFDSFVMFLFCQKQRTVTSVTCQRAKETSDRNKYCTIKQYLQYQHQLGII